MTERNLETSLQGSSASTRMILESVLEGNELSRDDAEFLFHTKGQDLDALLATADYVRKETVGDTVTFVVVRNINFTNVCYVGCRFCAFARPETSPEAWRFSASEVADKAEEAAARGATEVCLQGGLDPRLRGESYVDILRSIKDRVPGIHIHAFSPFEIKFGSKLMKSSYRDFLLLLKENGLGTIPGTAAEILDREVRKVLTKNKLTADEWVEIIETAHSLGIRSTATIMYGHIDEPRHWAAHIDLIRSIQKRTGGFTEFVPLGFVHWEAPLYFQDQARPGPTREENLKMHAVARLMLRGWIDNIQVSWVKLGHSLAVEVLKSGANDLGGTLMNESITRLAGGKHGQETTPLLMTRMARQAGRVPAQRNTLYDIIETFDDHDPPEQEFLVQAVG